MTEEEIGRFARIIEDSRNVVFFGGAGVSTESGIPDFRSAGGVFSGKSDLPPEEIVSHGYFTAHPDLFYRFYRERMVFPDARPNAAHRYLARLERAGKLSAVVTQNIDGLHQAAGSENVFELHGSVHRNHCTRCGKFYGLDFIVGAAGVPRCSCGGIVKPDVVLYGEGLDENVIEGAVDAIARADALIIGGTSLVVYPAAGFVDFFRGEHLVVVNRTPISADRNAELSIEGSIGEVFSALDDRGIV